MQKCIKFKFIASIDRIRLKSHNQWLLPSQIPAAAAASTAPSVASKAPFPKPFQNFSVPNAIVAPVTPPATVFAAPPNQSPTSFQKFSV